MTSHRHPMPRRLAFDGQGPRGSAVKAVVALAGALWCQAVAGPAWSGETHSCQIVPHVLVNVSAPVEGVLKSIEADRGDLVKEGQVLATLESSVEEAAVAAAKYKAEMQAALKSRQTRFEFSQRKLARAEEMAKKQTISVHELDEARTEHVLAEQGLLEAQEGRRLAELEYVRAAAALSLRTIRSPVTGVVVERLVSVGDYRNSLQNQVMRLAQISPLRVEVFAPVSMLGRIALGMTAEVIPEAPLSDPRLATVTVIDRVVDAASGTFGIRLALPNPDNQLPAGLQCRIRFLQDSRNGAGSSHDATRP